jgi:hypothetical protein
MQEKKERKTTSKRKVVDSKANGHARWVLSSRMGAGPNYSLYSAADHALQKKGGIQMIPLMSHQLWS